MTVQESEAAVRELSPDELATFRRWFFEFDADGWRSARAELERHLVSRLAGPLEPLETNWKERVRRSAADLRES